MGEVLVWKPKPALVGLKELTCFLKPLLCEVGRWGWGGKKTIVPEVAAY